MTTLCSNTVTKLLASIGQGEQSAQEQLWSLLYDELRALARRQMAHEAPGKTLQPTALVNEVWLRLFGGQAVDFANRRHFFAAAAEAMRRIRIDDARRHGREKRGGGERPAELKDGPAVFDDDQVDILAVNEALEKLEKTHPRVVEVVKLRYFTGLTVDEVAEVMGVAPRTVDSNWHFARAWLHRELADGDTRST